jgi:dolichol-phosphate mannosyltransferase
MNELELSILIPAYLEEENLRILLPRIKKIVGDLAISYEVIVVDTISPLDNTELVCQDHAVMYINRENGNKYGDAVRSAIKYGKGRYFLFMDADGSHSPEFIKTMYSGLMGNDVIIASRYVDGGRSDNRKILIFMSWCVNAMYTWFFGLKCKDVSNSFKIYKGDLLREISLKCNNFDVVEEILIKLKRNNKTLKIKEIPYTFKERMFGHTKRNLVAYVFSYVFTLLKLKFYV